MDFPSTLDKLNTNSTMRVGVVLLDDFSMMSFSNATEPLRALNRILGTQKFSWEFLGFGKDYSTASNSLNIKVKDVFKNDDDYDVYMFIGGYYKNDLLEQDNISNWIRNQYYKDKVFIAVSGASYLLAKTGILDGKKCTIHWEYLDTFKEENPELKVTDNLYEIDGNIITVSGGSASFDFMLLMAEKYFGKKVSVEIADQFIHQERRQSTELQHSSYIEKYGIHNERMIQILTYMENHIEDPLAIEDIAKLINISTRQINRLFVKYLKISPNSYYLSIRLNKAQSYLSSTSMSISQVALACGFSSFSHFSKAYKNKFNHSPKNERLVQNAI